MNGRCLPFDTLRANGIVIVVCQLIHKLRASGVGRFCEPGHLRPIGAHHGFLFFTAPAFDLLLGRQCLLTRRKILRKHKLQRAALEGVAGGERTGVVLADALFKVVGMAGVVAVVGTADDVDPEGHLMSALSARFWLRVCRRPPFDKLRANGTMTLVGRDLVERSNH